MRQPSNPELVTDTRERAHTPAPLPPDTKKQDSPGKPTQEPPTLSSPTNPPATTAATCALPPSVPVTTTATSHPPPQVVAVPSSDPPVTHSHPPEGVGVTAGPSDAGTSAQGSGRGEISIEPHPPKEVAKPVVPVEGVAKLLESSSTNSLINSPIAASLEEAVQSPPTEQDSQPPVSDAATNTSTQTGQEREKAMVGAAVSSSSSSVAGALQVTEETHHAPGTNGGKKKATRGKGKMTLTLINVTPDDVVKCMLVTKNELKIRFQFSSKFDETKAIFKKLVSTNNTVCK